MSKIIPRLFLAGLQEVIDETETRALGVTHILNVAYEIRSLRPEYAYKHLGVGDDDQVDDIRDILDECVYCIAAALKVGGTIMVHCWLLSLEPLRLLCDFKIYIIVIIMSNGRNFHFIICNLRPADSEDRTMNQDLPIKSQGTGCPSQMVTLDRNLDRLPLTLKRTSFKIEVPTYFYLKLLPNYER